MKYKILIVDDEKNIIETIKAYLKKENYDVFIANNGEEALKIFAKEKIDLILLDLMLPKISGEEVCKKIRKISLIPIIIVSAKINDDSKVNCFEIGADDYVIKPFSIKELIARIKSHLKKNNKINNKIKFNDLLIDFDNYEVFENNEKINLTPSEFKILTFLIKNPYRTFKRNELIDLIFSDNYDIYERTIDTHIKNIRKKIKGDYIVTVRSFGYRLNSEVYNEIKK